MIGKGEKILILEPDEKTREWFIRFLGFRGFDPITAISPEEALSRLEENKLPGAAICEIFFSNGGSIGYFDFSVPLKVLELRQKEGVIVPTILLAVRDDSRRLDEAIRKCRPFWVVKKPFKEEEILRALDFVLFNP